MKGKLIVIDGVDSSGKETQTKMLLQRLQKDGKAVKSVSFPNYDRPYSAGVKMYLAGDFGKKPQDVNAYAASTLYAVDRFASFKENWGEDLERGTTILCDRYTTSNAIHQGVKLTMQARKDYFTWLYDFEYGLLQLPKPDVVIFLDMPPQKGMELMQKRKNKATGEEKKDIHESDSAYLHACYETAIEACQQYGWVRVKSVDDAGALRNIEDINDEIYKIVYTMLYVENGCSEEIC